MEESAVRRPRVRDLNAHLICVLCGGYYVDATTIVDCLHSFCRSCIVRHLETSKFCPICDVQVHKAKPLHSIRPDRTLQTLVYKMVPCLYQAEVQRRREFFAKNGVTVVSPEQSGVDDGFFSPDDSISLSLEYYDSEKPDDAEDSDEPDMANQDTPLRRRYLQCPAAVSMKHLKKFIRMKFGLSSEHRVDIIYAGECLRDDFTLMDVAYTFAWKRNAPMRFSYRIFHPPLYCIPTTPTKKVSTSMPERAAAPPQLQPQEEQPPQQQDPLSSSTSTSTKVSETTPSRTESSENNGDSSVTPEASSPSPQADNKDDIVNSVVPETEASRQETPAVEEEDEEDNEKEMDEPATEETLEDEEPPHKKLCIDERKCDDDSGYEAVETREQDEEEREVEEEGATMEVTEEQQEAEESIEQEKVEEVSNTETEYKIIQEPVVEKRVSSHKSKRRRKSSHAKEKERSRIVEEPEEVQQTIEEKEAEENEEEEEEAAAVTQVAEEEEQREEEEEEEEQQEEQQEEEEEEEEETEYQEQETPTTPVEEPAPADEVENERDFAVRSSTSDEEEEEEHTEVPPSTKRSKSSERRESKEERRRYSKDSEERRRSKSKRDGSTREYGSRKKSKHKSKHHHRGDDTSSKKQRKAHRLLSEVTATPTILQYQEDVMKLKVKLCPIKPVIANLNAAAAANHQHRHHHHHHHSKHSRKLQEAKESQPSTPEARSPSPTGEIWECSTVPPKTNIVTTAATTSITTTSSSNTNKTSANSSPSTSPPPTAGKESSDISAAVSVSSSGTTTTTTTTTANTVTTTSVTTVSNTLNNALNSTKERLLQMRAVRHKNITSNKSSDFSSGTESKQEETNNVNSKKSPTSMSELLMPSSSITVSKVPMGEKRKLNAQKPNNSSSSEAKRPSLEIMLVNAPSPTANSQSTNSSSSSSSSMMSKQCTGSEATEKKGTVLNDGVKANRPPPPTIPLVKIRKSSVSSIRAPAGLTITPKLPSSPSSSSPVSNVPSMSCTTIPKTPLSLKMSPVSSPQIRSETGNKQGVSEEQAMRHDDIGALDLSGKSSRCKSSGSASSSPQVFYRSQSSPGTGSKGSSSSPASSIMTIAQNLVQRQLTNLQHQNNNSSTDSPTSNGNAKSPGGGEGTSSTGTPGVGTPPALTNLKTLSDTAVHIRNMMAAQSGTVKIPQQKVQASNSPSLNRAAAPYNSAAPRNNTSLPVAHLLQQSPAARSSTPYHPTLPNAISPLRIPVPPSQLSKGNSTGNGNMPRLRELFPGGVAGRGRGAIGPQNRTPMKPGPNQAVRQIPNPSALLFRQTQNRLQQNAAGMTSQNRLHMSTSVNSINKPVYNSPGPSTTNNKPNNANPPVSSIRKIENMTRNIEKVAAGLTVRAVEAHVTNK